MRINEYETSSLLGQGTFGKVFQATNKNTGAKVALKIIKSISKYTDAALREIKILQRIARHDPENTHRCIHLTLNFMYKHHVVLEFPFIRGGSLFSYTESTSFAPIPLKNIRSIAKQLIDAVAFIHRLEMVHTDLKPGISNKTNPENIMLEYIPHARTRSSHKEFSIILIDFGSTVQKDERHSAIVSTRHYRAPEILLGVSWSFPCDVWSIGCILVEIFTGPVLFQTHENLEHLRIIEIILGRIDRKSTV